MIFEHIFVYNLRNFHEILVIFIVNVVNVIKVTILMTLMTKSPLGHCHSINKACMNSFAKKIQSLVLPQNSEVNDLEIFRFEESGLAPPVIPSCFNKLPTVC